MNVEFGTSNRGRPTLLYQAYEYVKKQETNTTHWICRHYRQIKCSSLVITSGSEIIKTPKDHICNFKPGATEARAFSRVFLPFPAATRFFQTPGSWNLWKPGIEFFGFPGKTGKWKVRTRFINFTGTSSTHLATNAIVKAVQYRSSSAMYKFFWLIDE